MDWAFAIMVKMLLGNQHCTLECLGSSPTPCPIPACLKWASWEASVIWWLKYLGPWHPNKRLGLNYHIIALIWSNSGRRKIFFSLFAFQTNKQTKKARRNSKSNKRSHIWRINIALIDFNAWSEYQSWKK